LTARVELPAWSKIARDITERKKTERQLALLVREAEHRTKNILSTVLATVYPHRNPIRWTV